MTTKERLAKALLNAKAPEEMVAAAARGRYDDYECEESATPCIDLVNDARRHGLTGIADRAIAGEFEATSEESEAWARRMESDPEVGPLLKTLGLGPKGEK